MDLNPFTYIEKYIVEHGSAVVLEKHLALIKDQLAAAESKLVEADRRSLLASERASLAESRATKAEELAAELQMKLRDLTEKGDVLVDAQAQILRLLHHGGTLSVEQMANFIGMSAPDTKFHVEKLREYKYVEIDINKTVSASRSPHRSPINRALGQARPRGVETLGYYYILNKGREHIVTKSG